MGYDPRLDAVLRAGEAHRQVTTGDGVLAALGNLTGTLTAKLTGNEGADAVKKTPSAPPKAERSKTMPMMMVKKAPDENMSEWLKDLVNSYQAESDKRKENLNAVRNAAKKCNDDSASDVIKSIKEQEDATKAIIDSLKKKLKYKSDALDELRSSSAENLTEKGECNALTKSLQSALDTLNATTNTERDQAKAEAKTELERTVAEWTTKVKELQVKAATSGADASKELVEKINELEAMQASLRSETEAVSALTMATHKKDAEFKKAVEDACKLLRDALN